MYRLTAALLCLLSFTSCHQDVFVEEPPQVQNSNIPSELIPYFESFEKEASLHGLTIDYEAANITAEMRFINEGSVAGTCTTNGHNLRHITIDQAFWNRAPNLTKEMIVYHELGHCILGRGHEEGTFQNGICQSIMRSGLGQCRDAYNARNRAYFVEELFDNLE